MADHPAIFLARKLLTEGKPDHAFEALRGALARAPSNADLHYNAAGILMESGRYDQAQFFAERAAALAPKAGLYVSLFGETLMHTGKFPNAEKQFRAALKLDAKLYSARHNLANIRIAAMDYDEAERLLREAIALRPDRPEAAVNLANVLVDTARAAEGRRLAEQTIVRFPGHGLASACLANLLNYTPGATRDEVAAAHRRFGDLLCNHTQALPPPSNTPDPARKLRVAFVSADFREHSVAYFMEPVFKHLPRDSCEVFAFSRATKPDATTARLRALADRWIDAAAMTDAELADAIRTHAIDIAVELSGLTQGNCLATFAMRPAPVQLSYLGYPNTTGLRTIQGRLTDRIADPAGEPPLRDGEAAIALDPTFLCYRSAAQLHGQPWPDTAPARDPAAPLTFASFNVISKLNEPLADTWAALLHAVPGATLLLKARSLASAGLRARLHGWFEARGIPASRLELLAHVPSHADHLALYRRVDVALDPFPYNGTTTTCEALSMGVPVVTLRGSAHAGRVGASLLSSVGLSRFVASSPEDYIRIAADLARDRTGLDDLRRTLRPTLAASPLGDGPAFGARLNHALREAWAAWCAKPV